MDFVGKWRWFFLFSIIMVVPGLISLMVPPRLYLGIEFTGGSTISVQFQNPVSETQLRDELAKLGHSEAIIQTAGANSFFIRMSTLKEGALQAGGKSEVQQITDGFATLSPIVGTPTLDSISGEVASDTVRTAILAVLLASAAILLYITWAFRKMPKPFRYGASAVIALFHDAFLVLGMFSIFGKLIHLEVNAMFIPAILTVIGFSVHDTIVVFDRIRENYIRTSDLPLARVVNGSILETMGRSLNTVITTLIAILSMLLIGGESLRPFLIAMFIGMATGAYSSIGVASQILVVWETGEIKHVFQRRTPQPAKVEGSA